tara:strand:+ start:458 stop:724 length:267 start_codon:yes stop_codon:yes gene_type:complete
MAVRTPVGRYHGAFRISSEMTRSISPSRPEGVIEWPAGISAQRMSDSMSSTWRGGGRSVSCFTSRTGVGSKPPGFRMFTHVVDRMPTR